MPHIIVKLWPGKSEQQDIQLTVEEIAKDEINVKHNRWRRMSL